MVTLVSYRAFIASLRWGAIGRRRTAKIVRSDAPAFPSFPFERASHSRSRGTFSNRVGKRKEGTEPEKVIGVEYGDERRRRSGDRSGVRRSAAELREIFRSFDRNNDGSLTQLGLGSLLRAIGLKQSPDQLEALIQKADTNSNGLVEFSEFVALVAPELVPAKSPYTEKQLFKRASPAISLTPTAIPVIRRQSSDDEEEEERSGGSPVGRSQAARSGSNVVGRSRGGAVEGGEGKGWFCVRAQCAVEGGRGKGPILCVCTVKERERKM